MIFFDMTDSFLANIWSTKDILASAAGQQLSHKRSAYDE
jgi:hypothetical protein